MPCNSLRQGMFTTTCSVSEKKKGNRVFLFTWPIAWVSITLSGYLTIPASEAKVWVYRIKQSKFCVSFPYRSEMTQHDTSTEIFWPCSQLSTRFTIVWPRELYDKICQTLLTWLPLSSGFGSGKWSPRRVPRETREVSVAFEVFRDRCAEGDSSMHLLARSRDLWLSEISALNAIKFLSRLSQGLQRRCGNDSLLWKELP